VPQFKVGEPAAAGVGAGDEAGEPVAVHVGEPRPAAGVERSFAGEELMGATTRIRPDQHLFVQTGGDLLEGEPSSGDVVFGGVGPGVSLAQNQYRWLAGTAPAVVDE